MPNNILFDYGYTVEDYARMGEADNPKRKAVKSEPRHCPQCKAITEETDRFCRNCGEALADVKSRIQLDLEKSQRDKDERSLLVIATAFAVGGFLAGKSADTFLTAMLNSIVDGFGVLLIVGVLYVLLYVVYSYFLGEKHKLGLVAKVIFCIAVMLVAAAISFLFKG